MHHTDGIGSKFRGGSTRDVRRVASPDCVPFFLLCGELKMATNRFKSPSFDWFRSFVLGRFYVFSFPKKISRRGRGVGHLRPTAIVSARKTTTTRKTKHVQRAPFCDSEQNGPRAGSKQLRDATFGQKWYLAWQKGRHLESVCVLKNEQTSQTHSAAAHPSSSSPFDGVCRITRGGEKPGKFRWNLKNVQKKRSRQVGCWCTGRS